MTMSVRSIVFALGLAWAAAASPAGAQPPEVTADHGDRESLSLTIYQDDRAVVQDRRGLRLPAGRAELRLDDVARTLMAQTVLLSLDRADVLEHSFDFDLLSPQALIERSVGETVSVYRPHPETGEDRIEEARILSAREGVILEIGGRIEILGGLPGRLVFPALPQGLAAQPQLAATVDAEQAGPATLMLTYQASGLDWNAEYVGILDPEETSLALTARVAVTNESGLDFAAAGVELVAGELEREPEAQPQQMRRMRLEAVSTAGDAAPSDEPLFGYHLYRLAEPMSLPDKQTKRRLLFHAPAVAAEKRYRFAARGFSSWERPRAVDLGLDFSNRARDGLGRAMPDGVVRIYRAGEGDRLRFLGEDRLGPTPEEAEVSLALGRAFDVTVTGEAEDRQMLVNTRDRQVYESRQSYRLANAGDEAATVEFEQAMPGRAWEIIESSLEAETIGADRAIWQVPVPAGGETTLRFTVRVEN